MAANNSTINKSAGRGITSLSLKVIAFISLTCYCVAFSGLISSLALKALLAVIGSICIPIFALLIDEACKRTGNMNKLMIRSLAIAILAAVPYKYTFASETNVTDIRSYFSAALTSFLCIGALYIYERMKTRNQRIFCMIFVCAMSMLIGTEWAPHALIITFMIHILRDRKFMQTAYYISSFVIVISIVSLYFWTATDYGTYSADELLRNIGMIGAIFALPLIKRYEGAHGRTNKAVTFFSYAYYPLMLGIIVAVKMLL